MDSTWSVRLIDGSLVAERAITRQIGQVLDALVLNSEPTVEQVQQALIEISGSDGIAVTHVLDAYRKWRT